MSKINIAIVGLGNCASSLLQGIEYYRQFPEAVDDSNGLMHSSIGPYRPFDIELVAAFDIDRRKVGRPASEAIFAPPNNTKVFCPRLQDAGPTVQMGPVLDGFPPHMFDYPENRRFAPAEQEPVDVAAVLRESGAEILVNYLPVGSQRATEFYAQAALDAGVALVNCIPVFIVRLNLAHYDGILAFGESLAQMYRGALGMPNVHVFHEAADTRTFFPVQSEKEHDVVWIGNWGDDERADQIRDYLIGTAADLPGLQFMVHGVRYPKPVLRSFRKAGIRYRGWIANFDVPRVFAKARMTMHIMRSFYCTSLPGIPTIRPFEAMACGIPLITTRWFDAERLFDEGHDYLMAQSPEQMRQHIQRLTASERLRQEIAGNALQTIRNRHNCDVRAEQLEHICQDMTAQVA